MDNVFGVNVRTFRNVLLRDSIFGDDTIIADDSFITGSTLGEHVIVERRNMVFNSEIGDYTITGFNDVIRNCKIGKYCSLAWNVTVGGAEHNIHALSTSFFPFDKAYGFVDQNYSEIEEAYSKPVSIGNDVWVAANAMILRGVTVGDGAVVGGGGIVKKDIAPYEIWAGVPAKKIGQRFSDEIISELMELKWWDLPIDIIKDNIGLFRKDVNWNTILEIKALLQ